jgi:hypothetical protein
MFQFSGFAPHTWCYTFSITGFPIRKSADQFVFANPRSLSQLITSFIAFKSQGILHAPLITFLQVYSITFFQYVKELHTIFAYDTFGGM